MISAVSSVKSMHYLPEAGTNGLILGDILGLRAGDMAAEDVLCLFLLPRAPLASDLPGLLKDSDEVFFGSAPRGVLSALTLADLAD
jgi:hypothetical protein